MKNLKFRNQLLIGFTIIIAFSLITSLIAIYELQSIKKDSELIIKHPFTVSNAAKDININITAIHRTMKDVASAKTTEDVERLMKIIARHDSIIHQSFKIIIERFLGDKSIVMDAYESYNDWPKIRREIADLSLAGRNEESFAITRGKGDAHVKLLIDKTTVLIDFALNKADEFNEKIETKSSRVIKGMMILIVSLLVISILSSFLISRSILKPIHNFIVNINEVFLNKTEINTARLKLSESALFEFTITELKSSHEKIFEQNKKLSSFNAELETQVNEKTLELHNQNNQLKLNSAALEAAANGIAITNLEGMIQWVNPSFTSLTGYSLSDAVGKNMRILNSGKSDKAYFKKLWDTILAGSYWHEEIINKRKDGSLYTEEQIITSVYNDKHEITNFVSVKQDITERKETEEKIIASENRFRSITSTASDAIISSGKSGKIESWNNAAETIFGYSTDEAIGQSLQLIMPKEFQKQHKEGLRRVNDGGEQKVIGKTVEVLGKKKDGQIFPVDLSLSTWQEKGEYKYSGIIRDITTRKEYEKVIEEANKRMSGELDVAKGIQMSMLPLTFPAYPKRKDFDIYGDLKPAREVGGDFYDFFFVDDDHLCFIVGDVSGKGVPAALMMAVCKTLLKSRASNDKSTASILTHVNDEMAKENNNYMFVTVYIAILNTTTGELTYSNAGHNPTYIKRKSGKVEKLTTLHGPVIAAMEGLTYKQSIGKLEEGDSIFLYTDGIPEAHDNNGELYSDNKLLDLLKEADFKSPKNIISKVIDSVAEFETGSEQFDDITALCVEYYGGGQAIHKSETLTISNTIDNIQKVIQSFEVFAEKIELSMPITMKMNIVFDELLANIVNYAFEDKKEHFIEVEFKMINNKLIIIIEDDGIPFNPFNEVPPNIKLGVEEREVGGLGIHIVTTLMDEFDYQRNINRNVITIIKYDIFSQ